MILPGWPTLSWDFWVTLTIGGGFGYCLGYFTAVMLMGKLYRRFNRIVRELAQLEEEECEK